MASSIQEEFQSKLQVYEVRKEHSFEFLNPKAKTVVVFNKAIEASDVKDCIKYCVSRNIWPDDSNIIILSGHHTSPEGKLKSTFSAFTSNISKHLEDLKIEIGEGLKNFSFSHVPISTVPTGYDLEGNLQFSLAGLSLDNLKSKFKDVLNSEEQNILLFATCFSKKSEVNCLIDACGLYPALFLSAEMGLVTRGRCFKLDEKQRSMLAKVSKV